MEPVEKTTPKNNIILIKYEQNCSFTQQQNQNQSDYRAYYNKTEMQSEQNEILWFQKCFSPKDAAYSLQRRNDNLQMLNFENSEEEPDDIFNRRKKKVSDLMIKQKKQVQLILNLKLMDPSKYFALINFSKFISTVKEQINGIKTDYYSDKTFFALKNSSQSEVNRLVGVLNNILKKVLTKEKASQFIQYKEEDQINKILEFLIIPRFLISKQKINRLSKDENLQENFVFLISNKCLGHYNNEANKKMPEQKQMTYIRQIISKKNGRQKFKKICSINHGNKFYKNYGQCYFQLYSKSLECLKYLQTELKKGKKFDQIKKNIENFPMQTEDTVGNSSNESSSCSLFSFGNMGMELKKLEDQQNSIDQQLRDNQPVGIHSNTEMKKQYGIKKLSSMPEQNFKKTIRQFNVKKAMTMQAKTTPNIILIKPPEYSEI